jgi:hypothetical protein
MTGTCLEDADDDPLTVPLINLVSRPGELIGYFAGFIFDRQLVETGLFASLQDRLFRNVCAASGVDSNDEKPRRPLIGPSESKLDPVELIETYLRGTPFIDLLLTPVPFVLPDKARFELSFGLQYWL